MWLGFMHDRTTSFSVNSKILLSALLEVNVKILLNPSCVVRQDTPLLYDNINEKVST